MLTLTSALKLASLGSEAKFMTIRDPIFFFLTERWLMALAGFGELGLVAFLVFSPNMKARLLMIGWFGLLCMTYHACVALSGVNLGCACLGDVFAWAKIDRQVT